MGGGLIVPRFNNAAVFLLLFFYNIYDQILKGQILTERLVFTAPFLGFFLILIIFKSKYILSISYFMVGAGIMLDSNNPDILLIISAYLFVCSYDLIKTRIYVYIIILGSILFISFRGINSDLSITNILALIAAFYYVFSIYFFQFKRGDRKVKIDVLNSLENEFLHEICNGASNEEAGQKLGIGDKYATSRFFGKIKEKLGTDSKIEVGAIYGATSKDED